MDTGSGITTDENSPSVRELVFWWVWDIFASMCGIQAVFCYANFVLTNYFGGLLSAFAVFVGLFVLRTKRKGGLLMNMLMQALLLCILIASAVEKFGAMVVYKYTVVRNVGIGQMVSCFVWMIVTLALWLQKDLLLQHKFVEKRAEIQQLAAQLSALSLTQTAAVTNRNARRSSSVISSTPYLLPSVADFSGPPPLATSAAGGGGGVGFAYPPEGSSSVKPPCGGYSGYYWDQVARGPNQPISPATLRPASTFHQGISPASCQTASRSLSFSHNSEFPRRGLQPEMETTPIGASPPARTPPSEVVRDLAREFSN